MQDAANVMDCHTRSARNAFSNNVDRTLGLANDLKNRIRRLTTHKEEVKLVEYHPHSDDNYDSTTLAKTSWRLTKWVKKIWGIHNAVLRDELECGFGEIPDTDDEQDESMEDPDDPLPDKWEHVHEPETSEDNKRIAGKVSATTLQKVIETIKTAARRVSAKYRKSCREETKQALDCNSQESDKQMFRYLRGDQAPASAAMYDPIRQQLIFDTCARMN